MTKRIVSGVLLLDKPDGMSSHTALARAKRLFMSADFDSKKAGHTGTLDPMATGLLPICLGEATKFSQFGLNADKAYIATIKLGSQTDTGDKMGQVIATSTIKDFNQDELDKVAMGFIGEQWQTPPMYSALKKDGKKLYEYARAGVEIERQPRQIYISQFTLSGLSADEIELVVVCSKGTYVRVLGEAVAQMLGMAGHLTALRRTMTGGFGLGDAVTLEELASLDFEQRFVKLLPVDSMMVHLPKLVLDSSQAQRVRLGQRLNVKQQINSADHDQMVRLYHDGVFIGLGELSGLGRLQPIRMTSG